jgi:hypothetical protein
MKEKALQKGSTVFLRAAVLAIGGIVLALCVFALPALWTSVDGDKEYGDIAYAFYWIVGLLYAGAIPFFYALYQSLKLIGYIDTNKAFSKASVRALKRIAWCGVVIAVLFAAMEPWLYVWAEHDDAPGVILFGMIIAGASLTISVFAAVLQRLLSQAIDIKKENDLTV